MIDLDKKVEIHSQGSNPKVVKSEYKEWIKDDRSR